MCLEFSLKMWLRVEFSSYLSFRVQMSINRRETNTRKLNTSFKNSRVIWWCKASASKIISSFSTWGLDGGSSSEIKCSRSIKEK